VALGKLKFLNKESWVNVQGLMSLGHEKLIRRLGQLPAPQMEQVKTALRFALDL
jgi:mRNA-degrading endonuclease toxin of MazEF toxin-antitoxin module